MEDIKTDDMYTLTNGQTIKVGQLVKGFARVVYDNGVAEYISLGRLRRLVKERKEADAEQSQVD